MAFRTATATTGLTTQPSSPGSLGAWNFWGEYAGVALLPNASGNAFAAPGFLLLQPGDLAFVAGDVYTCVSPGAAGASNAIWRRASTETVFRWDGVGTSQFKLAPNFDNFPNGVPADTTLTVVADGGIGNMLHLHTTRAGSGVYACALWLINQSFPKIVGGNQYRYLIRARIVNVMVGGGVVTGFGGFGYLCTDVGGVGQYGFVSVVHPTGNLNMRARLEAGAVQTGGVPAVVGSPPDLIVNLELVANHPPLANPDFDHAIWSVAAGNVLGDTYREAAIGAGAFGAGWGTQILDRVGIALFENPGGAGPGTITLDIADLAVLRHPIDF